MSSSVGPDSQETAAPKPPQQPGHPNGYRPQAAPMVDVRPPQSEDLQPSYAKTLAGETDAGHNGWYGGMSE